MSAVEQWPWSVLGIEATSNPVIIKRAYAALLKQARPDEHPQAYQALRAAYESALDPQASSGQATPRAEPMPEEGADFEEPADVQAALATVSGLLHHPPTGHDLANAQASWRALREALESLPLQARDEASLAWAQAVSRHFTLSSWFALELARYFGWTSDYRLAEILGAARLRDLRAWLQEHESRVRDEESFARLRQVAPKQAAPHVRPTPTMAVPAKQPRWAWLRRVLRRA